MSKLALFKTMPAGKTIKYGVYENNNFIGVVIYSRGANNNLLKPYGLDCTEGCELTRIALKSHISNVSKIVSITIRMLKKYCPKLRLIVSFADSRQGHLGIIYQASNFIYTGSVKTTPDYYINGRWVHQRTLSSKFKSISEIVKKLPQRDGGNRLRYLYPLDSNIKETILKLKKPFPKKCESSLIKNNNLPVIDDSKI